MSVFDLETPLRMLPPEARAGILNRVAQVSEVDLHALTAAHPDLALADAFIENAIGYFSLPFGVASHFVIDGVERWIPMAIEETSIIAAASSTAKWVSRHGVIRTWIESFDVIGQVQLPQVSDSVRVRETLEAHRMELLAAANEAVPGLVRRGGGFKDFRVRMLPRPEPGLAMVVIDLFCNPCDAMGANLLNQACEAVKPLIAEWTGERVGLCILSNLTDTRLACAEVVMEGIDAELGERIEEATLFARLDPYRAATHNKGVMNGIDAVLIATGNDWRAVEAGMHAHASRSGQYQPFTDWRFKDGKLTGLLEAPLAVGTVGGMTKLHPGARFALSLLGAPSSAELARFCAAVGLVQNLAALRALCTTGIVRGHMRLHAANLALAAGADFNESSEVVQALVSRVDVSGRLTLKDAEEVLGRIRAKGRAASPMVV